MTDSAGHWQSVYEGKAPTEVSWFQAEPARSLAWIAEVCPDKDTPIIDVGAGASLLCDRLLDRGYRHISLLDIAPGALAHTRKRLGERADTVTWYTGDLLSFKATRPFGLWHDRAVLHFLRDVNDRRRYVDVLRDSLQPGGYALIATFAVGGPTRCSGLDIVQYDCPSLQALLGDDFECIRESREQHQTPGGSEQLFQYCLFRYLPA